MIIPTICRGQEYKQGRCSHRAVAVTEMRGAGGSNPGDASRSTLYMFFEGNRTFANVSDMECCRKKR